MRDRPQRRSCLGLTCGSPSVRSEPVGMQMLISDVWKLLQFPLLWCKWKVGEVETKACLQGSALQIRTSWQDGWSMCFADPLAPIAHFIPQLLASPSAAPGLSSACWPACSWKKNTSATLVLKLGLKNTVVLEWRITHFLLSLQRTTCAWDCSSCSLQF